MTAPPPGASLARRRRQLDFAVGGLALGRLNVLEALAPAHPFQLVPRVRRRWLGSITRRIAWRCPLLFTARLSRL